MLLISPANDVSFIINEFEREKALSGFPIKRIYFKIKSPKSLTNRLFVQIKWEILCNNYSLTSKLENLSRELLYL